jgi:hypothetical protein
MRAMNEDQSSMQPIRSHLIRISDMMKVQILRKIPFLRGVELQQLQMLSPLLKYAFLVQNPACTLIIFNRLCPCETIKGIGSCSRSSSSARKEILARSSM